MRFTNDPVLPMIDDSLRPIGEFLAASMSDLLEVDAQGVLRVSGKWYVPSADRPRTARLPERLSVGLSAACWPAICSCATRSTECPSEAVNDREMSAPTALQSAIVIPLESGGRRARRAVDCVASRSADGRQDDLTQLTLVAEVLANACARRRSDWQLQEARHGLAHVSRLSSMGELTASLAHQLNQPLAGILTNAQAARHMLDSGSPDLSEISDVIDDIISDDHRAADVIRRVRDMLTPGETELSPMDVNVLVDDVSKLVASDALLRNVSIAFMLATGQTGGDGEPRGPRAGAPQRPHQRDRRRRHRAGQGTGRDGEDAAHRRARADSRARSRSGTSRRCRAPDFRAFLLDEEIRDGHGSGGSPIARRAGGWLDPRQQR